MASLNQGYKVINRRFFCQSVQTYYYYAYVRILEVYFIYIFLIRRNLLIASLSFVICSGFFSLCLGAAAIFNVSIE